MDSEAVPVDDGQTSPQAEVGESHEENGGAAVSNGEAAAGEQQQAADPPAKDTTSDSPPPPTAAASTTNGKQNGAQAADDEAPKQEGANGASQHTNGGTQPAPCSSNGADGKNGEEQVCEKNSDGQLVTVCGDDLRNLLVGTDMIKVKGKRYLFRIFRLAEDLLRIVWISRRKAPVKAQIYLSQIQHVVAGKDTPTFRRNPHPQYPESVCLSVVYLQKGKEQYIDLIAPTPKERDLWVNGLQALIKNCLSTVTSEVRTRWLQKLYSEADKNGDGTLDLKEIVRMMKKLNVGVSPKLLKEKFQAVDDGDNSLQFSEFCTLFDELSDRPEVRRLFTLYKSESAFMTCEDLKSFLEGEQGEEEMTSGYCQSIIERFEPSSEGVDKSLLSLDGFVQFLLSPDCDIFRREHSEVYQDMTHPLSHYYIASSHNTYLLEDQLQGPSSVQAYINALKRGCRCVELDCWNGDHKEPVVYHGHTLTSKILFKDAIKAIKDNAFVTSPYPVILSIENHCSVEQQHVMADYMTEIFGDMLYRERRDEERPCLPSPEELKYKILIKAKKLSKELEDLEDDDGGDVSDEDEAAEIDPEEIRQIKEKKQQADEGEGGKQQADEGEGGKEVEESQKANGGTVERTSSSSPTPKHNGKKVKLSAKLSKLVNYIQSVGFKNLTQNTTGPCYHMSSFGESKAIKLSDSSAPSYVEYNKCHISRTYPAGRRVDSSNYDPVDMWNCGCQIVALNYQTSGKAMDWNIGKFQQNGNSGYILKPDIMRQDIAVFNHKAKDITPGVPQRVLTVRIISGQQLPKPEGGSTTGEIIDPYVLVQITGISIDKAEYKTRVVDDNGFNPVWNEPLRHVLYFPEQAIVRFRVMDYDRLSQDDFIGQYTLPFSSINTGYRHIFLRNSKWEKIPGASLFIHIDVGEWIGPPTNLRQRAKELTVQLGSVKNTRHYPGLKPVIPELSQYYTVHSTVTALQTAVDLKENYQFSLLAFKESCGKPSSATLSDCIATMAAAAKALKITMRFITHTSSVSGKEAYEVEGTRESGEIVVSGSIHRVLFSFDELNHHLMCLLNTGEKTADELDKATTATVDMKDKVQTALKSDVLPEKKIAEARENYSWCVRVLQSETAQLQEAFNSAATTLQKITTAAEQCGITVSPSK